MKTIFEEIKYETKEERNKIECKYHCPSCGNGLVHTMIPCPENRLGCLVAHFGWQCVGCGKVWKLHEE